MDSLINLQFEKALVYPVIDPSLNLLFSSLVIWDKLELIWGEDTSQLEKFREYASNSPIFYDHGFVLLKEPRKTEIDKASKRLFELKPDYENEILNDDGFSESFIINPIKITQAYWRNARKSKDSFINIPAELGRLYMALLAEEISQREKNIIPTLTTRLDEALFLKGGVNKSIKYSQDECIAKAGIKCLIPDSDLDNLSCEQVNLLCEDILEIRKLDTWYLWREELFGYKQKLREINSSIEISVIAEKLDEKVRKFNDELHKQKLSIIGKTTITIISSVIGFLVGSFPGALLGAATSGAFSTIDLYQTHNQRKNMLSSSEKFIIDARKILSEYRSNNFSS
jgi:hypothetical protein